MKYAFPIIVILALSAIISSCQARPMWMLSPQHVPAGPMEEYKRQENKVAMSQHLSQHRGFLPEVIPQLFDVLTQILQGSAVRSHHTPGLSGEMTVLQNSPEAQANVQSIRRGAVAVVKPHM